METTAVIWAIKETKPRNHSGKYVFDYDKKKRMTIDSYRRSVDLLVGMFYPEKLTYWRTLKPSEMIDFLPEVNLNCIGLDIDSCGLICNHLFTDVESAERFIRLISTQPNQYATIKMYHQV